MNDANSSRVNRYLVRYYYSFYLLPAPACRCNFKLHIKHITNTYQKGRTDKRTNQDKLTSENCTIPTRIHIHKSISAQIQ